MVRLVVGICMNDAAVAIWVWLEWTGFERCAGSILRGSCIELWCFEGLRPLLFELALKPSHVAMAPIRGRAVEVPTGACME